MIVIGIRYHTENAWTSLEDFSFPWNEENSGSTLDAQLSSGVRHVKELRALLRGKFGPLWSQKLKVAYHQILMIGLLEE